MDDDGMQSSARIIAGAVERLEGLLLRAQRAAECFQEAVELQALAALVASDTARIELETKRYGELQSEPNHDAVLKLEGALKTRGVL